MALSQFQPPLPCRLHLRAINPERNVAREYQLEVQRDLFGHWIVALHWGRIGASGQGRILSFDQFDDASRFVGHNLARRKSARNRIGVDYVLVNGAQVALKHSV